MRCSVVVGLVGRWHDGDMSDDDLDAFEQHLMVCPPCLVYNDKVRIAMAALPTAAGAVAEEELVRDLVDLVRRS